MINEVFRYFESPEFWARANIAETTSAFRRIVLGDPHSNLLQFRMTTADGRQEVVARILEMLRMPEGQYEHQGDAGMAAYLLVLQRLNLADAKRVGQAVHRANRGDLWWTNKVAADALGQPLPVIQEVVFTSTPMTAAVGPRMQAFIISSGDEFALDLVMPNENTKNVLPRRDRDDKYDAGCSNFLVGGRF